MEKCIGFRRMSQRVSKCTGTLLRTLLPMFPNSTQVYIFSACSTCVHETFLKQCKPHVAVVSPSKPFANFTKPLLCVLCVCVSLPYLWPSSLHTVTDDNDNVQDRRPDYAAQSTVSATCDCAVAARQRADQRHSIVARAHGQRTQGEGAHGARRKTDGRHAADGPEAPFRGRRAAASGVH